MSDLKHGNIFEAFSSTASMYPDNTAVEYLGTKYSYRKLLGLVESFAGGLARFGIKKTDRIMMYIPNSVQLVLAWLSAHRLGAIIIPISPIYTVPDLKYLANDTESKIIICSDRNFGYVKQIIPDSSIQKVIVTNVVDMLPLWKKAFGFLADKVPKGKIEKSDTVLPLNSVLSSGSSPAPKPELDETDIAEIIYTGGTTKHPKGVPISHGLLLESSDEQLGVRDPLFPKNKDVIMGGAPLFHIAGQTCSLSTVVIGGGTLILHPKVNLDAMFDSIQRNRATSLIGVPALYRMILDHDRTDQYDLSSLKYCFSAADVLPQEIGARWERKFHKQIYQGYGATETCGGVCMAPTDRPLPPLTMGKLLPSKEVLITELDGVDPLPLGVPGELLVHSKRMVSAYFNKPEETARAFVAINDKLFYRTGDIVKSDEEGFFYFVDRTVDVIKSKGYRISASEVEAVLQEHPSVVESCVVGIPDKKVGERIKAFVVLKSDVKGISGSDLIKWCRKRLIEYKVPNYIEFRDMLPKSKVGKLLRREIRSEERKRLET